MNNKTNQANIETNKGSTTRQTNKQNQQEQIKNNQANKTKRISRHTKPTKTKHNKQTIEKQATKLSHRKKLTNDSNQQSKTK